MNWWERASKFYRTNKLKCWLILLGVPSALLMVGSLLFPEIFWDRFLWRYFYGPVVADAEGQDVNGITAGYNPVNTAGYALALIVTFLGVYELLEHFEVEVKKKMIYSILPWIVLGGSLRSLEDQGLFRPPLDRMTISPLIYIVLGLFVVFLLSLYYLTDLSDHKMGESKENLYRALLITPVPFIYLFSSPFLEHHSPEFYVVVLCGIAAFYLAGLKYLKFDETYLLLANGTMFLLLSLSYNIKYSISANPEEIFLITGLTLLITSMIFLTLWAGDKIFKGKDASTVLDVFIQPLNLLIIFSHLLDASSTYRGISAYGYVEKHVLPEVFIEATGPWIMIPINLLLVILVIYILDILLKDELKEMNNIVLIIKFLVITLGAAPAVRNTLRLAMGV